MNSGCLGLFHPLVSEWFTAKYGRPTEIQTAAWPRIAEGKHVLVTAPTGTGKTLTAFLYALNDIIAEPSGREDGIRILYVSPMKALNTDIHENLMGPLMELRQLFTERNEPFPAVRVLTRSGDTPANERRRMSSHPPDILITTPESLNLLLLSGSVSFHGLKTLILDEIHALLPEKRGTLLISAVERLTLSAGEFQRIALSATLRDTAETACFVGGFIRKDGKQKPRKVHVIQTPAQKKLDVILDYTAQAEWAARHSFRERADGQTIWESLGRRIRTVIKDAKSTLVFVNSRRAAEKLAHLINEEEGGLLVYSHHGSLSREIRSEVESKLKKGELRGIVATSSLELGIDIGVMDRVLLVETPFSLSSAVQRIGRAGHSVGEISRGIVFPLHSLDLLRSQVLLSCIEKGELEPLTIPENPLDILAQIILSMTAVAAGNKDDLFDFLTTIYPYRSLPRPAYDGVIDMLMGRYASTRIKELRAYLSADPETEELIPGPGVRLALYAKGGAIPERGYFKLRNAETGAVVGEVDEEFVWERSIGDRFSFGNRTWKIVSLNSSQVEILPYSGSVNIYAFWKGESALASFLFYEEIGKYLESWLIRKAEKNGKKTDRAEEDLDLFLARQREACGGLLPHRNRIVIENPLSPGEGIGEIIIHAFWGGKVTLPFSFALKSLLKKSGYETDVYAENAAVFFGFPLQRPAPETVARLIRQLADEDLRSLIIEGLSSSGFFGARFRENAGRALLLPDAGFGKRMPFWLLRLKSKALLEKAGSLPGFPILTETYRQCLEDIFDLGSLDRLAAEIRHGRIQIGTCVTKHPSPFAEEVRWKAVNTLMYAEEGTNPDLSLSLEEKDLLDLLLNSGRTDDAAAAGFVRRLKRTEPGYLPATREALEIWIRDRIFLSHEEWMELLSAAGAEGLSYGSDEEAEQLFSRDLTEARLPGAAEPVIIHRENLALISRVFHEKAGSSGKKTTLLPSEELLFSVWLSYHLFMTSGEVRPLWGLDEYRTSSLLGSLEQEGLLIRIEGGFCLRENYERFLRFARSQRRRAVTPEPLGKLQYFLAKTQGLSAQKPEKDPTAILEKLFGCPAPPEDWESRILPARLPGYTPALLDNLFATTELEWYGMGKRLIGFRSSGDTGLFPGPSETGSSSAAGAAVLRGVFRDPLGRYDFADLRRRMDLPAGEAVKILWDAAFQGEILCDSFEPVRRGILTKFSPPKEETDLPPSEMGRARLRRSFGALRRSFPSLGLWKRSEPQPGPADIVEELEIQKDRVRILLGRYGVLFRELLQKEAPGFRWKDIFTALRMMDLSGEIYSGTVFEGIPGLQFFDPAALASLSAPPGKGDIFVMNARDPASLCGIPFASAAYGLPRRSASSDIVFDQDRPVLVSGSGGLQLDLRIPPEDEHLPLYVQLLMGFLAHRHPSSVLKVRRINGKPVHSSPYRLKFLEIGFKDAFQELHFWP